MNEYRIIQLNSKNLHRLVKVYIYLPLAHEKEDKQYPVVYMHDGQSLFDQGRDSDTWSLLEKMNDPHMPELIIVGINSSKTRSDELLPFQFTYEGQTYGGHAKQYYKFIIEELKPLIDQRFKTLKDAKNTALMGASFGGVSTLYGAVKHQQSFDLFASLSSAHAVINDDFLSFIKDSDLSGVKKLYLDVGTNESSGDAISSEDYINTNKALYQILQKKLPKDRCRFTIVEGALHNEEAWGKRFVQIIRFLFE